MAYRKCVICGKDFKCSPSDKTVTCSPQCRSERARQAATGKKRHWNAESRERLSAAGETPNLRKGTDAAKLSPNSGRFDTNINAKTWVIKSPEGVIYEVTNLLNWARTHAYLFDMDNNDKNANRIAHGFIAIKRFAQGALKSPVTSYKGWQLLSWDDTNKKTLTN